MCIVKSGQFDTAHKSNSDREIQIKDKVLCCTGPGVLWRRDIDCSVEIKLTPWEFKVTYGLEFYGPCGARLKRLEPSLVDDHKTSRNSDQSITKDWVASIDCFHRTHNAVSPRKNNIAKRRHADFPRQQQITHCIYRMETWDELWKSFQNYSPEISNCIRNENKPNECPSILRRLASWERGN